ncbi:MAG: arginine deiminase family protein [Spirochaetia bacterium]
MLPLRIESEIEPLEAVVVHRPGVEIEQMTPDRAGDHLYNDILPISTVSGEHELLVEVLSAHARVYEMTDLLTEALEQDGTRTRLLDRICVEPFAQRRREELSSLAPGDLARSVITGLRKYSCSLEDYLSPRSWDVPPLSNLYFMRDAGFVIGNRAVVGAMAHDVRDAEAAVTDAVFHAWVGGTLEIRGHDGGHPEAAESAPAPSTRPLIDREVRIEGGDVHVLSADLLLIGISERTSTRAVDVLCASLAETFERPLRVIACLLPRTRSCIHLDMVFSRIDYECALVHAPVVFGPSAMRTVRFDIEPGGSVRVREGGSLMEALSHAGCDLKPVVCGGSDTLHQQREQWLSGTNAFALAPGRILVYDCNRYTLDALDKAGYPIVTPGQGAFSSPLHGRQSQTNTTGRENARASLLEDTQARAVIALPGAELARGGGGPRCMTMPVRRAAARGIDPEVR